jgi:hypothetical protein
MQVTDCYSLRTAEECVASAEEGPICIWANGSAFRLTAAGECLTVDGGPGGACFPQGASDDGCGSGATCPRESTAVYYDVLGDGIVEIVALTAFSTCDVPESPFELCSFVEGDPDSFDPPECKCGCN